ncbi:MAG: DUF4445 domain-containing protein [Clostridia bacterium]|nr:DUF4445 domain-containing protein [Clostridia bacterium]
MIEGIIRIKGKRHFVQAQKGVTALSLFRETGGAIYAPCGGNGTCGKCRMYIKGDVSEPDERERSFLSPRELESGIRLACMCRLLGDFEIVPMDEAMRIQTSSKCVSYTPSPILRTKRTENETVFYRDRAEFCRASADAGNLGLAVDLGTTTVAAYLCDMDSGEILSARGFKNPQSAYGADVISRMDKIMKDESLLAVQQKLVCSAIREAAQAMCEEKSVEILNVRAAVICGNTVMQHVAAGINPVSISVAPFTAPTLFGEEYDAHALGLLPNEKAIAYFAPCFASYVGGDIACGMIATGLDVCRERVLFVDVGTNGEIGLSTEKGLYFCSAAAGPAFEGAHIACGMAGISGAISKVSVRDGEITYETVDGAPAVGICGSGIVDAVAVMLDTGLLDETGLIAESDEAGTFASYIGEDEDGNPVFFLDKKRNIYICAKDIREIQLAKAAVCAGALTLLHESGIDAQSVSRVVIAGGFGSHLRAESVRRIGLLPPIAVEKYEFVGNAAGAGAVAVLLGEEPRASTGTICEKSEYTELSKSSYFMEKYIEEMMFSEENGEEI